MFFDGSWLSSAGVKSPAGADDEAAPVVGAEDGGAPAPLAVPLVRVVQAERSARQASAATRRGCEVSMVIFLLSRTPWPSLWPRPLLRVRAAYLDFTG
jgi:hypothetical protein